MNGENTIAHQHLNDFECRKWVLGPNDPPITVLGYQVDGQPIAEEFHVLSQHESEARAIDYGRDVGTISMVVYHERAGEPPAELPRRRTTKILPFSSAAFSPVRHRPTSSPCNNNYAAAGTTRKCAA